MSALPNLEQPDDDPLVWLEDVDGDRALFRALAHAADVWVWAGHIQVIHIERHKFCDAQPRGVQQLEHRAIAACFRRVALQRLLEQFIDFGDRQRLRQRTAHPRRLEALRRVAANRAFRLKILEERLHRGDFARDRRLGIVALLERRKIFDDQIALQLTPVARPAVSAETYEKRIELAQVVLVRCNRIAGRALLDRHEVEEVPYLIIH